MKKDNDRTKELYSNLLAGVSLLGAVALSTPVKAVEIKEGSQSTTSAKSRKSKNDDGMSSESAPTTLQEQKLETAQQTFSFKSLSPQVFAMIAEGLDVASLAHLIQTESGLIDMAIKGGYNPQIPLISEAENPWKTADNLIGSFTKQFQESLNVEGLLAVCGSFEGKSLKYAHFILGHAWKQFKLDDTLKNVSQIKSNPEGDYSGKDFAFASLIEGGLSAAKLTDANLTGANLMGADLFAAKLIRANLKNANLINATLGGANLTDTNLDGAQLNGMIINLAIMTPEQKADYMSRGAIELE